jgi:hypothetical protein
MKPTINRNKRTKWTGVALPATVPLFRFMVAPDYFYRPYINVMSVQILFRTRLEFEPSNSAFRSGSCLVLLCPSHRVSYITLGTPLVVIHMCRSTREYVSEPVMATGAAAVLSYIFY